MKVNMQQAETGIQRHRTAAGPNHSPVIVSDDMTTYPPSLTPAGKSHRKILKEGEAELVFAVVSLHFCH